MIFSMEEADWDAVMKVHLKGHFAPTKFACAHWRDQTKSTGAPVRASVINTSSLVGLEGNIGQTNYAAAKGGIAMFTIALGLEMERYGVRSNCVAPSGNTRLISATLGTAPAPEPDEYVEWDERDPGNVAPLIVWLGSDLSQHVTGQVFMSKGASITHYTPWQQNVTVTVPGGDRKWEPEEIGIALNTFAFSTRHPGYVSRGLFHPTSIR
jgi:NAD(P)-dependent dehydrogenase (short-subunit alcohol dehydrogenase family)